MTFREIYDAHVHFVWRVLLRLGIHENDLPDAVQDVFVVVHRKLPEFEGRSKLTTWLFAICARVASDRRLLAHARREVPSSDQPWLGGSCEPDEGALLDQRRARQLFDAIVLRMPDEQRIVFLLFEVEGLTGDAIAALLALPVGTVRSRLRLARATFEAALVRMQASERTRAASLLRPREA